MNSKPQKAKAIFDLVVDYPSPGERLTRLRELCGDDIELRVRVQNLLKAFDDAGSFLDSPPSDVVVEMTSEFATEPIGTTIGPYKLLQQIGEGGFGVVYMAEQHRPVRRRVALKVVKPGMDSKQVIARFEAERQALAMMDHPNIAKILDVGTTESGRPYFVMELVHGTPITQYCDDSKLSVRERLRLFELVCQAIQHAHQKGVIHRDIKPSNILVAEYDDVAVPKVIDFGLAKALQATLTEKTLFTQFGQLIGTLEYMSPEQAKLNQLDIDTRTDIYSLGVVLYELMTGQTPIDSQSLRNAAFDEMLKLIREVEPPKPSRRFKHDPKSSTAAVSRQSDPRKLYTALSGDMDAIVMKSLSKERSRRYDSSSSLGEDIRRFINNEPVIARSPAPLYLAKKFVSRHRVVFGAVTAIACSLVLSLVGITVMWQQSRRHAHRMSQLATKEKQFNVVLVEKSEEIKAYATSSKQLAEEMTKVAEKNRRIAYVADIDLAYREWDEGNLSRAKQLLSRYVPAEDGDPDLRHFEWYHVWRLCAESEPNHEIRFDDNRKKHGFEGVTLNASGTPLVIAMLPQSTQPQYAVWNIDSTPTWSNGNRIDMPWDSPNIACSPDGKSVAFTQGQLAGTKSNDGDLTRKIVISDLITGDAILEHNIDDDLRNAGLIFGQDDAWGATDLLQYSPDGKLLVARSRNFAVFCWNVTEDNHLSPSWHHPPPDGFRAHAFRGIPRGLAFTADGETLAIVNSDSTVALVDSGNGSISNVLNSGRVDGLCFIPESSRLLTASANKIQVWDTSNTAAPVDQSSPEKKDITDIAVSPDGRLVAFPQGPNIYVRDLKTWDLKKTLKGHVGSHSRIQFSPDGSFVLTGDDRSLKFWALQGNPARPPFISRRFDSPTVKVLPTMWGALAFHPNENWLACTHGPGAAFAVCNFDNGTMKTMPKSATDSQAWTVGFTPDGETLVTGRFGTNVQFWDWRNRKERRERCSGGAAVVDRAGRYVATTVGDGVLVFDYKTLSQVSRLKSGDDVKYFGGYPAFSSEAPHLAALAQNHVQLLDILNNNVLWTKKFSGPTHQPNVVEFSPDGELIMPIRLGAPSISIRRAKDGSTYWEIPAHPESGVKHGTISPDGRTLVSTGYDGTLRFWDLENRELRFSMKPDSGNYNGTAFSPDGKILAVSHDRTVRLLRAATDADLLRLKEGSIVAKF